MLPGDRAEVLSILRQMSEHGTTLRKVWTSWLERPKALAGSKTLGDAVRECVQAKRDTGRRKKYVDSLDSILDAFAKGREATPVSALTSDDISEWVAARYTSPWSVATARSRLSTLFAYCERRRWIAENPCHHLERIKIDDKPPAILTVRQSAKVLVFIKRKHPKGLAWFTLALMAGIRPEECDRLSWDAVNLKDGIVTVDAAASKVRRRRIIHLQPAASAWLKLAKDLEAELPLAYITRRRYLRALREKLGFASWPQDILRHTCASYLMAEWQDAGRVAAELGNSAGVLLRHYRELVRKQDAERFWKLEPRLGGRHETDGNESP